MSFPANQWTTYGVGWPQSIDSSVAANTKGLRENLLGITIIDPDDVPGWALLSKQPLDTPYVEWFYEALATTATGGAPEGASFSSIKRALTGRTRLSNTTQLFASGFEVSRTMQKTSQRGYAAGVPNEYQKQAGKKLQEITRNMDARLWANSTAVASSSGGTASNGADRLMAAVRAFPVIATSVGGAFATGSFAALHETMDDAGAKPDTLFVSTGVKADISNLILGLNLSTATRTQRVFNDETMSKTFASIIDFIVDDYGKVMVVRDRWIPQASATSSASADAPAYFLVEKSKLEIQIFDPPQHIPIPPDGLSDRGIVFSEISLKVLHPSCVGIGWNVTT